MKALTALLAAAVAILGVVAGVSPAAGQGDGDRAEASDQQSQDLEVRVRPAGEIGGLQVRHES